MWLIGVLSFVVLISAVGNSSMSFESFLVGYVSSVIVIAASARSFSSMVKSSISPHNIELGMDRDIIDNLEDPHGLYEESQTSELRAEKDKKIGIKDAIKSSRASFSLYRVFAYGLLVLGFFYLRDNGLFWPVSYLVGITLPMIVIVSVLFFKKGRL